MTVLANWGLRSRRAAQLFLLVPAFVLGAGGCGAADDDATDTMSLVCDAVAISGLAVVVTDGVNGPRVCDATVTASEQGSGAQRVLEGWGGGENCGYSDFLGLEGVWDVSATTPSGATGAVSGVAVTRTADGCYTVTAQVTIVVE